MISQYNNTDLGEGVRGLVQLVFKQLRMEGFLVSTYADMRPAFTADMAGWVASGKVTWRETVETGIENAPPPS